ncbi:uncharacterized protein LOC100186163 isoform X1 [Ciona intestinalis]
MALEAYGVYIPPDIPPGQFASKLVKAVHTDTRDNIFPCDSPYGRDWSESILYLGRKKRTSESSNKCECDVTMESPRVILPMEHPLEGRNNPQPSKAFMDWRVPSRYSDKAGRPTTREAEVMGRIQAQSRARSSRQHEVTHTTHHPPPPGKFQPIRSEQQEHMAEVLRMKSALRDRGQVTTLPRLSFSANHSTEKPLEPRTYSAAQRWLIKNPGKEHLAEQVLRQNGRTEVDRLLENTLEPNARKAVREWLKHASESDRRAAMRFFTTMAGRRLLGGPSGRHPAPNMHGDKNARLSAVLDTLRTNKGQAPQQLDMGHATVDDHIKSLLKAARRKHIRILTPETRLRHKELQTWHHMPVYNYSGNIQNTRSMYVKPNASIPKDFRIHPEWEP